MFDWQLGKYWFPNIRSLPGAIFVLCVVLYPYVYLITCVALCSSPLPPLKAPEPRCLAPEKLLAGGHALAGRPSLPATLALMETLADSAPWNTLASPYLPPAYSEWYGIGDTQALAGGYFVAACGRADPG